jgi:hypothetical protein
MAPIPLHRCHRAPRALHRIPALLQDRRHQDGADFIAEVIRLLAAFHPSNLAPKEVPATPKDTEPDIAF